MWWLDDGPLAETQGLESDPPEPNGRDAWGELRALHPLRVGNIGSANQAHGVTSAELDDRRTTQPAPLPSSDEATDLARQLAAEKDCRLAAEAQLEATRSQHAEELAARHLQIRTLEESVEKSEATCQALEAARHELAVAGDQRNANHAGQIAELKQSQQASQVALQKSETLRATETQSLRSEFLVIQTQLAESEKARTELEAAAEKRNHAHAAELVAIAEANQETETALRESESSRARETDTLQSELRRLGQALAEAETTRGELQAAITQRNTESAEQLAQSEQALENAVDRADELTARLSSLEEAAATLKARLVTECRERSVVESDLRAIRCRLAADTTSLRSEMEALRRTAEEQAASQADRVGKVERARQAAESRVRDVEAELQSRGEATSSLELRLETEIKNRLAAEYALDQCRTDHAAEQAGLHAQNLALRQTLDTNEAMRREFESVAELREAEQARIVAAAGQAQEVAQQRATQLAANLAAKECEVASLQINLEKESASRVDVEAELLRTTTELREEAAKTAGAYRDLQRDSAKQHDQLSANLAAKECEVATLQINLEKESASRVDVEAELLRATAELREEAAKTAGAYRDLQRDSAEQHDLLAAEAAQLRQVCNDRERQLRERDEQIAHQLSELEQRQESERRTQLEREQLSAQHARQTASLETQVAELRSHAAAAQTSKIRIEDELKRVEDDLKQQAEERDRQLAEERQQRLRSQSQVTDLQLECERRQHELDQLRDAGAAVMEAERAARRRIEEQIDRLNLLKRELDATRSSAAEADARNTSELAELRAALTGQTSKLAANHDQIKQLQQQLQEAIQRNADEQVIRQRAEAFRGLAQREAAARKKLEAAIKRTVDRADGGASLRKTRANMEFNERIHRLTTELTATRSQELSVRQRAAQEIKRAREESQNLKDQLERERKAA